MATMTQDVRFRPPLIKYAERFVNRRDYDNFPMRPLGWKAPNQVLRDYLASA